VPGRRPANIPRARPPMIPTYEAAMPAVLSVLSDGQPRHRHAIADGVADQFQLTADERDQQYGSQKGTLIRGRTGWALTYLKQAGLVATSRRAWYQITDRGREALALPGAQIDRRFLERYPEFREFMNRSRGRSIDEDQNAPMSDAPSLGLAPDEALEQAYRTLRADVEQELLDTVKAASSRKGIFLTTSHFTKDAEEYVTRIDSRIILVDGRRLAALMFDYEVGVAPRSTYTVKGIDGDYFDET
jgi:restriction endonuclease Mrr